MCTYIHVYIYLILLIYFVKSYMYTLWYVHTTSLLIIIYNKLYDIIIILFISQKSIEIK